MRNFQCSVLVLTLCIGLVFGTACSPQNRTNDLAGCLQSMKEILADTDLFWFGDDYQTACPNGPSDGRDCSNPTPGAGLSVADRLLGNGFNDSLLTMFLRLHYTSEMGSYTGCGNTFNFDETTTFDVDPTSSVIVQPWFTRHTPEMTWDSTPGEYYSLYVYDLGYYITHAVYINIEGNNIPTSGPNVIDLYHGPMITSPLHNPYLFMLFKQGGYLEPIAAQEWYNASHTVLGMASSSHIPDFISLLNMTGPIAMNWIVATGDAYAAERMYARGFVFTCPIFIGQALYMTPRPFLPDPPVQLSVGMDVTFHVDEFNFTVCCIQHKEESRSFMLNPIGSELLNTSATRTESNPTFTFEKVAPLMMNMNLNFNGDMHTMIAFDPDVPSTTVGNTSFPLLHQMQINIMDGNFTSGEEVIPWGGPTPPNDEPHYYYFFLYKHMVPVTREAMTSYAGDCGPGLSGRCLYDINRAAQENNFTLVGANWFRAERDLYVRYRQLLRSPNDTATICMTESRYPASCETSAGRSITVTGVFVFIVGLISFVL